MHSGKNFGRLVIELEKKIDKLQKRVDEIDAKLTKHIELIEKVYEGLQNPIKKIKNWFN